MEFFPYSSTSSSSSRGEDLDGHRQDDHGGAERRSGDLGPVVPAGWHWLARPTPSAALASPRPDNSINCVSATWRPAAGGWGRGGAALRALGVAGRYRLPRSFRAEALENISLAGADAKQHELRPAAGPAGSAGPAGRRIGRSGVGFQIPSKSLPGTRHPGHRPGADAASLGPRRSRPRLNQKRRRPRQPGVEPTTLLVLTTHSHLGPFTFEQGNTRKE